MIASPRSGRSRWYEEGEEPDYRFTLANERTFLAWIRSALALIAGAIALEQFVPPFQVAGARQILSVAAAVGAAGLTCVAYRRWVVTQMAMRLNQPLPHSRLVGIVTVLVVASALAVAVLLVLQ